MFIFHLQLLLNSFICLFTGPFNSQFFRSFVCLVINLFVCFFIYLFISSFIYLFIYLFNYFLCVYYKAEWVQFSVPTVLLCLRRSQTKSTHTAS